MPLDFQQQFFSGQAAAESGEGIIGTYNTMTGNYDGNRIAADGSTDCPYGGWTSNLPGYIGISCQLPEFNGLKTFPDSFLKIGPRKFDRNGKLFKTPGKEGLEFLPGLNQQVVIFFAGQVILPAQALFVMLAH